MEALPEEPPRRPPIAHAPISVILLTAGSTSDAAESVSDWQTYLATLERPFELLLLPLDPALGLGPALRGACLAAQHPLVMLTTADQQFQPADLAVLLKVIDNVDLAVGCRQVAPRPWWRRAIRWTLGWLGWAVIGLPVLPDHGTPGATAWRRRWVARWLFGLRLLDPQSPFRLARREALTRIVLQARGVFALVEQLAKANHLEMILAEEPVGWSPPDTLPEGGPFAAEARALFRRPDFGPPELHVPAPAEKALPSPTEALPPSSEPGVNLPRED